MPLALTEHMNTAVSTKGEVNVTALVHTHEEESRGTAA